MSGGVWLTSAAIAAVLVAVFIYPWQRRLEHDFLLRNEKRTLYRDAISKIVYASKALHGDAEGYLDASSDLNKFYYEMDLVEFEPGSGRELRLKMGQVIECVETCRAFEQRAKDGEDVDQTPDRENPHTELGRLIYEISVLMRDDLASTVRTTPRWVEKALSIVRRKK